MTYYYINDKGLMDKKVGGDPPASTFVAVSPDGIMRKFDNGVVKAVIPSDALKDSIEYKNASLLLGLGNSPRRHGRIKSKSKSKRKCRCKK